MIRASKVQGQAINGSSFSQLAGIAFFEYIFQVPANRPGYGQFNGAQLKTIQEVAAEKRVQQIFRLQ